MFLFGFPLWVCACWYLGPLAFVWLHPSPLVAYWDATMFGIHPSDVGHLAAYLSYLCLALHDRVSHVSLFMCLITCLALPFV